MPESPWSGVWRWEEFEVDPAAHEVRRAGVRLGVQDQPFEILVALLERPRVEVTREELFRRLWPEDTFVDREGGLNTAVKKLRDALGDSAQSPRYIETRARHGYRFVAALDTVASRAAASDGPAALQAPPGVASRRAGRWLAWVAASLVAAAALLAGLRWRGVSEPPVEHATLLVLPFLNLSGDPAQDYFSDGMTDEMIARLGQLHADRVSVLGGATSRHYKGSPKQAEQIARELDADFTLAGSVRRAGSSVRITAELVRSRDRRLLWSQSYDRELRDILDLQRQVAEAISGELPVLGERRRLPEPRPIEPAAYEAYLKGRYFWDKVSAANERKAIAFFAEAVRLDPSFAPAYAWQGSAYQMLGNVGEIRSAEVLEKGWPLVERAVALDPESADAQSCFGWMSLLYRWDFAGAERAFRHALDINPDFANARNGLATYEIIMGHGENAVREIERAHASDPLSLVTDADVGLILHLAGRDGEALLRLRRTLDLDPDYAPAHYFLSRVQRHLGEDGEAFAHWLESTTIILGGEPPWLTEQRRAFADGGWLGWRRHVVKDVRLDPAVARGFALFVAECYLDLGEPEEALAWLETAYDERPYAIAYLGVDPVWAPLHGEPRFQGLLRRIGLPPSSAELKTAAAN